MSSYIEPRICSQVIEICKITIEGFVKNEKCQLTRNLNEHQLKITGALVEVYSSKCYLVFSSISVLIYFSDAYQALCCLSKNPNLPFLAYDSKIFDLAIATSVLIMSCRDTWRLSLNENVKTGAKRARDEILTPRSILLSLCLHWSSVAAHYQASTRNWPISSDFVEKSCLKSIKCLLSSPELLLSSLSIFQDLKKVLSITTSQAAVDPFSALLTRFGNKDSIFVTCRSSLTMICSLLNESPVVYGKEDSNSSTMSPSDGDSGNSLPDISHRSPNAHSERNLLTMVLTAFQSSFFRHPTRSCETINKKAALFHGLTTLASIADNILSSTDSNYSYDSTEPDDDLSLSDPSPIEFSDDEIEVSPISA